MKKRYYTAALTQERANELSKYAQSVNYEQSSICIVDCMLWESMLSLWLAPERESDVQMTAVYLED